MFRILALSTSAIALSATAAMAAPALGLVGDKTLVMFDTETLAVSGTMEVTGVDSLLGIDLRPSNNTVVGVTPDMTIVSIDTATGEATEMSTMDTPLPVADSQVIVDFNPAADRLRFMTDTTNHRVNVDTGEVTVDGSLDWVEGDMHMGETPDIVAAAYINSYGQPESTAMYDIDATIAGLIQQTSPNDGTLSAIGKLGLDAPAQAYAFDVQTTAELENTAFLVNGNTLYTVDLATGVATSVGMIESVDGEIRDVTVLPAM
ncbi:DUF4394 domain-containing protein [Loktanella sp. TSTF-M6]|uniref:DUF4394 domain-containing protein n=1 Tax=Loktanella gaetbuli TaxID=2881335 RepID=A0ABS8BWB5_9RHOB|nr:DUF4394 domain-containing protein [Loktanella gaetbuli]MCB5200036.1 DUF4394 domain-containing protein [Loktanella gaetbuli]